MKWQCNKGHTWEAIFDSIKRGSWCPKCAKNIKGASQRLTMHNCNEAAKENKGKCLSYKYLNANTKMKWQCNKGHIWEATYSNIYQGSWCPKCAKNKRLSIQYCYNIAKKNNGKCLSNEYINNYTKMKWQCNKGHIWEASLNSIQQKHWCPKCNTNKTEKQVRKIFETKFNKQFPTVRPDFLKNPATGYNLELDGYCEELKLAFEYDGEQHYHDFTFRFQKNKTLKEIKKRDELKNKLCKEHGIVLIRIPYWKKDDLEGYIFRQFSRRYNDIYKQKG